MVYTTYRNGDLGDLYGFIIALPTLVIYQHVCKMFPVLAEMMGYLEHDIT
jgi:hypothetical protein